jgi:hypothetical protein
MARRKKAKLVRARKGTLSKGRKSARSHYIRGRAKRLAYAKRYYRKNKAKILKRRKRYYRLTKGTPFYKSNKPGGRIPRGKRKKYAKRTGGSRRRRA